MTITATFNYDHTIPEFVHTPFRNTPDHPLERLAKAVILRALEDLRTVRAFFARLREEPSPAKRTQMTKRFHSFYNTTPTWMLLELEAFFHGDGLRIWCAVADWDPETIRRAWNDPTVLEALG